MRFRGGWILAAALAVVIFLGTLSITWFLLRFLEIGEGMAFWSAVVAIVATGWVTWTVLRVSGATRRPAAADLSLAVDAANDPSSDSWVASSSFEIPDIGIAHHRERISVGSLLFLLVAAGFAAFGFGAATDTRPDGEWDAIAIWNYQARMLSGVPAGADMRTYLAREQATGQGHPDYPLFIPAAIAALHELTDTTGPWASQTIAVAFLFAAAAFVFVGARSFGSDTFAVILAAVVLATPPIVRYGAAQYADIPLAALLVAAAGGLATQLDLRRAAGMPTATAGFCLGCLPWMKNEGFVLMIVLAVTFFAILLLRRELRDRAIEIGGAVVLGATPPLAVTLLFRSEWAPPNDYMADVGTGLFGRLFNGERWGEVVVSFGNSLLGGLRDVFSPTTISGVEAGRHFGLAWIGLIGLLACGRFATARRSPSAVYLIVVFVVMIFAWLVVYVATPRPLEWHLQTSAVRLLAQLWPLGLITAAAWVRMPARVPKAS